MKKIGTIGCMCVLFCSVLFAGTTANAASSADVPRIDIETLKGLLEGPEAVPVLLDVRTGASWSGSDSMIESAVREDPGDVASWIEKYEKDETIVLYCT